MQKRAITVNIKTWEKLSEIKLKKKLSTLDSVIELALKKLER